MLKKFISRVNHIHCKDIRKEILNKSLSDDLSFRDSFLEGVFTVPGDGCIDYKPLLKILYENKYNKWLVVEAEQDPKKANPIEYAKIGYNYLTKVLTEVGYKF
jgi:inosose dehydratase